MVTRNLKEGKELQAVHLANLWSDEQKSQRQALRIRLLVKSKSNSYTESANVNAADRWRERLCSYPGRSRKRERVDIFESERSNNELREVSRGHSTMKEMGRAEQS